MFINRTMDNNLLLICCKWVINQKGVINKCKISIKLKSLMLNEDREIIIPVYSHKILETLTCTSVTETKVCLRPEIDRSVSVTSHKES